MTEKFFSIKPLDTAHLSGQKVLKAEEYEQWISYEHLLQQVEQRHHQHERVASIALARSIQRGKEQGLAQANQQAAEQMLHFSTRMNETLAGLENQLVEVVSTAVRKIIRGFDDEEKVRQAVLGGLELVRGSHALTIRVNPQMQTSVSEQLDTIPHRFTTLEVVGDATLQTDDCILESDIGIVDASLEQQMQVIERTLRDAFAQSAEPG